MSITFEHSPPLNSELYSEAPNVASESDRGRLVSTLPTKADSANISQWENNLNAASEADNLSLIGEKIGDDLEVKLYSNFEDLRSTFKEAVVTKPDNNIEAEVAIVDRNDIEDTLDDAIENRVGASSGRKTEANKSVTQTFKQQVAAAKEQQLVAVKLREKTKRVTSSSKVGKLDPNKNYKVYRRKDRKNYQGDEDGQHD